MVKVRLSAIVPLVLACAAGWVGACGPGLFDGLTGGSKDAATDPSDALPPPPPVDAGCAHAYAPERPTVADGPDTAERVFAMERLRLDTGNQASSLPKPAGLDLDRRCTCPEESACARPDGGAVCDDPNGRDNQGANFIAQILPGVPGLRPTAIEDELRNGVYSVLVRVSAWNGTADDPQVNVSLLLSPGLEGRLTDAGPRAPKFDGTDVWAVHPRSLQDGNALVGQSCSTPGVFCLPIYTTSSAYVRGDVLVAPFPVVPIAVGLESGSFELEIRSGTLVATLERSGGKLALVGEISGRVSSESLLSSVTSFINPITKLPICPGDPSYETLKQTICALPDIPLDPTKDGTNQRCDAISNALGFRAPEAKVGAVIPPPSGTPACDGGTPKCD